MLHHVEEPPIVNTARVFDIEDVVYGGDARVIEKAYRGVAVHLPLGCRAGVDEKELGMGDKRECVCEKRVRGGEMRGEKECVCARERDMERRNERGEKHRK